MRPRVPVLIAALLLVGCIATMAAEQSGKGVVFLGAGFTERPFALGQDVVLETDGYWNCLRDYGDPDLPGWLGWHDVSDSGGLWRDVLWDAGLTASLQVYLFAGARFVDYSDPTAPVSLGEITGATYTSGFLRDRLFFATLANLLVVYDVTDPATPQLVFPLPLMPSTEPRWFCNVDGVVYFIEAGVTIRAVDATDRTAIRDLGSFTLTGDRLDALAASAGALHALVATQLSPDHHRVDLVTYALTSPIEPVESDRVELAAGLGARGRQLHRRDDLLLASENQLATHAFDLTEPTQPVGGFTLPVPAEHLTITAGRILTQVSDEVRVFTRTEAAGQPTPLATRRSLPVLRAVSGDGPLLLGQLAKDNSLLAAIDVTDPPNPHLVATTDVELDGVLHHHGDLAVLAHGQDAHLLDVSDPTVPVRLAALRLVDGIETERIAFDDQLLAIGLFTGNATALFDISDPGATFEVGRLEQTDEPLAMGNSTLIYRHEDGFGLYDLTDPDRPNHRELTELAGESIDAAIAGDHGYCLARDGATVLLHVIDLTDLDASVPDTTLVLDHDGALTTTPSRLYVGNANRLTVLDLTDPAAPLRVGRIDLAFPSDRCLGTNEDLIVVGRTLVTARDLSWPEPEEPEDPDSEIPPATALTAVYPNPFNPRTTIAFAVDTARDLTLAVYDLRGRKITTLASGPFAPGQHTVIWDGTTKAGAPAPAAVYLVRLTAPGLDSILPATLIR